MSVVRKAMRACVTAAWSSLPLRVRALLKDYPDRVRLDYRRKDLYLAVSSPMDVGRAAACAKEPGTVRWIEEQVSGVFYDIGANVGAYSLVAWAFSNGRTRVIAFEPGFSTFPQLCRNILLNGSEGQITPLNIALSDHSGPEVFRYGSIDAGAAQHVGLSTGATASGSNDGRVVFQQQMWTHTLDDAIDRFQLPAPAHIKIDVDGHELAILVGAERTLKAGTVRSLQIEIGELDPDTAAIHSFLEGCGFSVDRVSPHVGGTIADLVFVAPARGSAA
jgi:FkbM family methyltransferase